MIKQLILTTSLVLTIQTSKPNVETPILSSDEKASYTELRNSFKEKLYKRQRSLMPNKEQYGALVDPLLDEAEKVLKVVQHCIQDPKSANCKSYFENLLNLNVASFYLQTLGSKAAKADYEKSSKELQLTIESIKNDTIQDLDCQEELKTTQEILNEGNKKYCEQLGILPKGALYISRFCVKIYDLFENKA